MQNLLDDLQNLLTQIAKGESEPRVAAEQALALVAELRTHRAGTMLIRGGAEVAYVVEKGANGEMLTERRKAGTAKPFRCPRAIYGALVEVLIHSDRALPLDDLLTAVSVALGDQVPEFQVRVPLRLWMSVEPPLVVRNRARYRPADQKEFERKALMLWDGLKTT